MRHRVHQEIFFICCLLLAFLLPVFPGLIPAIIVIIILNWVLSGIYIKTIPLLFKEKWRLLTLSFASLYLLYLLGMLYSTDYSYGWFDLEVKMSLFFFPVVFATSDLSIFTQARLRFFFKSFIAGCLVGSLVLLGHAWLVNARSGIPVPFYYTHLAWYFHPSYLAMYYTFGVGIVLYYLSCDFKVQPIQKTLGLALIIFYLEALIFLLSSKAGLIMLVTIELLFVLLLIFNKVGLKRIVLVSFLLGVAFFGFLNVFPFAFVRISTADSVITSSKTIQTNPEDGTVARMEIWKVSIGLIRENLFFGVGTGDVKDVLMDAYQQHNLNPVVNKKLNAHNQYLQTFITLGIFGFCLLLATLLIPALWSFRNENYIYTLLLIIFTINLLFESMLETQAGIVFYAFFNAFFFSTGSGTNLYVDAKNQP
jgi:O-antigen ligase